MDNFKVGDKITNIKSFNSPVDNNIYWIGTIFTVKDVSKDCIKIVDYKNGCLFYFPSDYFKLYIPKKRCIVCGKEIEDIDSVFYSTKYGNCCLSCIDIEIDVYKVELNDDWYITDNIDDVIEELKNMNEDDEYKITMVKMNKVKYLTLPEFMGF